MVIGGGPWLPARRLLCALLGVVALAAGVGWAPAAGGSAGNGLPPGFSTRRVFGGLDMPTALAFSRDRRVFVAEKSGLIKVYENLRDESPRIVANLRTKVYNAYDRGLLSIALHPDFPDTPWLYALYSFDGEIGDSGDEVPRWGAPGERSDPCPDPPGRNSDGCVISGRLSRLTLQGNDVVDRKTLVHDWCQQFPSHSVGDLAFGPDGALYASAGEGAAFLFADYGQRGSPPNPCGDPPTGVGGNQQPPSAEGGALRAQDLRTTDDPTGLSGSVIRIDPETGAPLPGNPVVSPDANARRIVAYGMRNPFRMAFRPDTNEIYVADTGWERADELDLVVDPSDPAVENFGWPCYEGPRQQPLYRSAGLAICSGLYGDAGAVTAPFASYAHDRDLEGLGGCGGAGGALSGLAFYEGGPYPDRFDGALFVADYARRCMWVLYPGTTGRPDPARTHRFSSLAYVVDLETGPRGDVFYVDITGSVGRIVHESGNQPPTARIRASRHWGPLPLEVKLSGRPSSDPEGHHLRYAWDLDWDGSFDDSRRARPRRVFRRSGVHKVGLRVRDGRGAAGVDKIKIHAGNHPPKISIEAPRRWYVGKDLELRARAVDPEDGRLPPSALAWKAGMRHCALPGECHLHPLEEKRGSAGFSFSAPDHDYPASLRIRVRARDSWGLADLERIDLEPRTSRLSLRSKPPGVRLVGGTRSRRAPFSFIGIVRSRVVLGAPLEHEADGRVYEFASWSHGRKRLHSVIVRRHDATYTARYRYE